MSIRTYEVARRHADGLVLVQTPVRARWELADLPTANQHTLRVTFHASLRAIDDPTERKSLEEMLMTSRDAVTAADLEAHYQPTLRTAVQHATQKQPADYWLDEIGRNALADLLRKTVGDISFACGVEALAPFQVEVESPTLRQQQLADMQRTLAEQQTAGRIEHFQRAVDLLHKIESQRTAAGATAISQAIETLNPTDRGEMLRTLLLAGSAKQPSTTLSLVAGTTVVRLALDASTPPLATVLPSQIGPFRSVQPATIGDAAHLLIGSRDGVLALHDLSRPADVIQYRDSGVESTQGFNRAIVHRDRIVGCHSEKGLVSWSIGQPEQPETSLRLSTLGGSPRNLVALDATSLLFSVDGRLITLDSAGSVQGVGEPSPHLIVAIVPDDSRFLIVFEDGTIRALDRVAKNLVTLEHRGRRVSSACGLPWLGGQRLLIASDEGPIECIGTDDDVVTQYLSPHRGVRRIVASTSHVAAIAADRSRVILWNVWDAKSPIREIPLAGVTHHRAADALLG